MSVVKGGRGYVQCGAAGCGARREGPLCQPCVRQIVLVIYCLERVTRGELLDVYFCGGSVG